MLKCRVFGGKTSQYPTGLVFRVISPVATVQFLVEPKPEPTREFGLVANTNLRVNSPSVSEHLVSHLSVSILSTS